MQRDIDETVRQVGMQDVTLCSIDPCLRGCMCSPNSPSVWYTWRAAEQVHRPGAAMSSAQAGTQGSVRNAEDMQILPGLVRAVTPRQDLVAAVLSGVGVPCAGPLRAPSERVKRKLVHA